MNYKEELMAILLTINKDRSNLDEVFEEIIDLQDVYAYKFREGLLR